MNSPETDFRYSARILASLILIFPFSASSHAQNTAHQGDVTNVRVIRRVEQHPYAWKIWQPFIIQGHKKIGKLRITP